jgi:hypothetical protein
MTGRQVEALRDALCDAFDPDSFDQLLRLRLDIDRAHIAGPEGLRTIAFKVITAAIREGWHAELIRAACAYNPGSPALRRFCDEYPDLAPAPGLTGREDAQTARSAGNASWPRPESRHWKQLHSLAEPTQRIRHLVVTERAVDGNRPTYSVIDPVQEPSGRGPEVPLGSRVFLAIETIQESHLLLLDHAPDGLTFCLCPSWFCPGTRLPPGTTLLPTDSAGCEPFALTGIPGLEELIAVFCSQPLCLDWMPKDRSMPARVLSEQDIHRVLTELKQLPAESWNALRTSVEVTV